MRGILGKWITNQTATPFYVRKEWSIEKKVKKAKAQVCGLGQFIFYMNGKKVDDHELDPGWTNYNRLIQFVTFDVTSYVQEGRNVLGAEVGNGWYYKMDEHYTFSFPPFMPPNPNPYKVFGQYLVFSIKLIVMYEDGTEQVLTADDTFRVNSHPVIMSNVYGSETIDGRLMQKDWTEVGFDDSSWSKAVIVKKEEEPKGDLINQFQPPIRVLKSYEGKYLHTIAKEEGGSRAIYDFGQNMSGILSFEVKGQVGDIVKIYPAEKLNADKDVDQMMKGWVLLDSCITYIIGQDKEWEECRMKFTYFAGRFMAVETSNPNIEIKNVYGHAISSAWKRDGNFSCDDKRYEQIYDMIEKTVEANMVSVHTDCPTIERFAWQEPNHLMAPSIFYMKDGKKLWEKFLLDMRIEQHKKEEWFYDLQGGKYYPGEGLMPSQCPCYIPNVLPVPGMGSFYDIIAWGSTCILGTNWHYEFYGDKQIIIDNYEAGLKYLTHLKTKVNEDGFINHGLGDWGNPKNELARENIETAFLYADVITLAKFADLLGKEKDKQELEVYAEKVKENYNKKLLVWDEEKGYWCYRIWTDSEKISKTQAVEAIPLYWNLVPEEKKNDVIRAFRDTLEEEGAFVSGEIGLPYIIQSARKYNLNHLISQFILRETHPSYYAFVLDGETTLGEYWETNPRSHCHDMMGHIIEWYYNGIAGILPQKAGFSQLLIRPYLPEGMKEFNCTYQSVAGKISVHVKEENEKILLEVDIADGIEYEIDTSNLEIRGNVTIM